MTSRLVCVVSLVLMLVATSGATGQDLPREEYRYNWKLRGGLAWIAGLRFPTSGIGALRYRSPSPSVVESELTITSPEDRSAYYKYQSHIDEASDRTLMSYTEYAFGKKHRSERTWFDYARRVARVHKTSYKRPPEDKTKSIQSDRLFRDVLTMIHHIRQNGTKVRGTVRAELFSDGKFYSVVFRPIGVKTFSIGGRPVSARGYEITAAPDQEKRWSGGVNLWVSNDAARVPIKIEIERNLASLQLELQSYGGGAGVQPARR